MKTRILTLLLVIFTMSMVIAPPPLSDGFEDGTLAPFTTSGSANWFITSAAGEQNTGTFGARSGSITNNQTSTMQITETIAVGGGTVSFSSRVSSEGSYDFLRFFIDGVQQEIWSGTVAFAIHCYPVTAGFHTFEWRYTKDYSVNSGLDAAFVDDVSIQDNVCAAPITPATGLGFGTVTASSIQLNSFTPPATCVASTGYVIKVNTVNTFTPPADAASLPASSTVYGGGEQVVYAGTSNTGVTVTGLSASTQYFYKVFAYNNCAGTNTFETTGAVANTTTLPPCAAPTAQVTGLSFGTLTSNSIPLNSFTAPVGGATGYVIKVNTVNTFTAPTNAVTLPTVDNSWNNAGEQVVFAGISNAGVTVTNLDPSTQYFYKVFAYNDCAGTNTFETTGVVANTTTPTCLIITPPVGTGNYWTGCISSDWNDARNWSQGTVPLATDAIYVPVGTANDLIITTTVTCAKMTIQIGAKCTVNYNAGGKLLVRF